MEEKVTRQNLAHTLANTVHVLDFVVHEGEQVQALQANNGMSNPTYVLWSPSNPSRKIILRKKPPGKLLPGARAKL